MKKRYLLVLLLFLVMPNMVSAKCSNERIAELAKIAENINIDYTYVIGPTDAEFTVTVSNLTNELYLIDNENNIRVSGTGSKVIDHIFWSGDSAIFTVYSNEKNCKGEAITSKYLSFPRYNKYSETDECQNNPEFKYCKQWMDTTAIQLETFENEINEYIKEKEASSVKKPKEKTFFEKYQTYIVFGGLALIIVIILIIAIVSKKKKSIL